MNIYLDLTREFNAQGFNAILSGGQAAVLHGVTVMGMDGEWILRENENAVEQVLGVLAARKAVYRFGAPLDLRWMRGGWSAHLSFGMVRCGSAPISSPVRLESRTRQSMNCGAGRKGARRRSWMPAT